MCLCLWLAFVTSIGIVGGGALFCFSSDLIESLGRPSSICTLSGMHTLHIGEKAKQNSDDLSAPLHPLIPRLSVNAGREMEPGIKMFALQQVLHTFRINRNLQDTCPCPVACGTSETNA